MIEATRQRVIGGARHPLAVSACRRMSGQGLADGGANALTGFNMLPGFVEFYYI
jgi:hypothetical protein